MVGGGEEGCAGHGGLQPSIHGNLCKSVGGWGGFVFGGGRSDCNPQTAIFCLPVKSVRMSNSGRLHKADTVLPPPFSLSHLTSYFTSQKLIHSIFLGVK